MQQSINIKIKFVGKNRTIALTWEAGDQETRLSIPDEAIPALIHDLALALVEKQAKQSKKTKQPHADTYSC
jgi:hypothetical protein